MDDICPKCEQRMVFCRACRRYVCERAREWANIGSNQMGWRCEGVWCAHDDYAKKNRFELLSDGGYWRIKDDETGKEHAFDNHVRKEYTLLHLLNQLAFELDALKRDLVERTE